MPQTFTPKDIAQKLLNNSYTERSVVLNPSGENEETEYAFELLITIFIEMIMYNREQIGDLNNYDISTVCNFLSNFKFPLKSLGIKMLIEWFGFSFENIKKYSNYYCKIIINDDNYTFLLNPAYQKQNRLKDIYAIFVHKDDIILINFS